jgi:subtilase family serine protease
VNTSQSTDTTDAYLGESDFFVLTDVATPRFLSQLYNIPQGMKVNYGSNQSVAEFYDEYYSNSDLIEFFKLTGLPNATIPEANVFGTNDQSDPGGEAQLDVEYLMVCIIRGFLDYLQVTYSILCVLLGPGSWC